MLVNVKRRMLDRFGPEKGISPITWHGVRNYRLDLFPFPRQRVSRLRRVGLVVTLACRSGNRFLWVPHGN